MSDSTLDPGQPLDPTGAFEEFIERDLPLDHERDWFSRMPPEVIQAAWIRFIERLGLQTQALIDDPQIDLWEELLSDEHQAIAAATEVVFPHISDPATYSGLSEEELLFLVRCVAVLTLHIEPIGRRCWNRPISCPTCIRARSAQRPTTMTTTKTRR